LINKNIKSEDLSILDGLQRTYCILNVIEDFEKGSKYNEIKVFNKKRIRAELWYDINITALLYKILVLNTGQVRMSIRHQLEILNIPLRKKIIEIGKQKNVRLKLSTYKDQKSTKDVYEYRFVDIVEALTAFITGDPIIDKTNEVVKELERMKFVEDHSKAKKLYSDEELEEFTNVLFKLDHNLWEKYKEKMKEEDIDGNEIEIKWTSRNEFINSAPILSGLFASFGKALRKNQTNYLERKNKFFDVLNIESEDPLQFKLLGQIIEEEKKTSKKFGNTVRKFFFKAFNEYFGGENDFQEIWKAGTEL